MTYESWRVTPQPFDRCKTHNGLRKSSTRRSMPKKNMGRTQAERPMGYPIPRDRELLDPKNRPGKRPDRDK